MVLSVPTTTTFKYASATQTVGDQGTSGAWTKIPPVFIAGSKDSTLVSDIAITNRLDASGNDIPLTIYYDTFFPNPTQNFINLVNTARVDSIDFYNFPDPLNQVFRSITGFIQNGESTYFDISGNYFDISGNLI